jgi:hypothetical protein
MHKSQKSDPTSVMSPDLTDRPDLHKLLNPDYVDKTKIKPVNKKILSLINKINETI